MPKKLTKREKTRLYSDELRDTDSQERAKKMCLKFARDLQIDLLEKNGTIYSREGEIEKVFHKPINPKKPWTEALWVLQERCYEKLSEKGKVADQ